MSKLPHHTTHVNGPNWAANIDALQRAGYRLRFGQAVIYVNGFAVNAEMFEKCDPDELLDNIERHIGPAAVPFQAPGDQKLAANIANFIVTMAGYGCPVTVEKIKMGGGK